MSEPARHILSKTGHLQLANGKAESHYLNHGRYKGVNATVMSIVKSLGAPGCMRRQVSDFG